MSLASEFKRVNKVMERDLTVLDLKVLQVDFTHENLTKLLRLVNKGKLTEFNVYVNYVSGNVYLGTNLYGNNKKVDTIHIDTLRGIKDTLGISTFVEAEKYIYTRIKPYAVQVKGVSKNEDFVSLLDIAKGLVDTSSPQVTPTNAKNVLRMLEEYTLSGYIEATNGKKEIYTTDRKILESCFRVKTGADKHIADVIFNRAYVNRVSDRESKVHAVWDVRYQDVGVFRTQTCTIEMIGVAGGDSDYPDKVRVIDAGVFLSQKKGKIPDYKGWVKANYPR